MGLMRAGLAGCAALALSACASVSSLGTGTGSVPAATPGAAGTGAVAVGTGDISSRAASPEMDLIAAQPEAGGDPKVVDFRIEVPATLRVSESASFYPMFTDIVWRGDAIGDRRAQVAAVIEEAAGRAVAGDAGTREVMAVAVLERFHGLTERAHYVTGGIYNVRFSMSYFDAETGAPVGEPRLVVANLAAPGGSVAVALDQQGQTEKVRLTDFLALRLAQEFAAPLAASL